MVQEVHKGFLEFVPEDIFDGLWLQSLLNADFNIVSGIENIHFKKVATHTLSKSQLLVGNNCRLHHRINKVKGTIFAASNRNQKWRVLDNDYMAVLT